MFALGAADKLVDSYLSTPGRMSHRSQTWSLKSLWVLLLLCLGVLLPAMAADHIVHRAYWEDPTGDLPFESVAAQEFTPYDGVLSRGFTPAAVWLRLEVVPPPGMSTQDSLVLRIRPVYLDEVRLYDPLDTSGKVRVVGDRTNYSDEEYKSLTHTFVIPGGDQPRQIWLRLKTSSTSLIAVEALTRQEMAEAEIRLLASNFVVMALIAVFLILVFINWMNAREFLYSVFLVRHGVYLIFTACFFGLHRVVFDGVVDATRLDTIYNWLVIGATGLSLFFEFIFLSEYALPRWARYVIYAMLAWSGCVAVLMACGQVLWALKANMVLNGSGAIGLLLLAQLCICDRKFTPDNAALLPKKWVVAYYFSIAALLAFSVLPYVGALAGNAFSINGLVMYALCSGTIMTVLMQLRANQLRQVNMRFAQDLLLSEQQVNFEKIRLEEQSQLLTMLMHELKTPLSVIDLAQQSTTDLQAKDYLSRNVTVIKNILDRCVNTDRVASGQIQLDPQPVHLRSLLDQLISDHPTGRVEMHWHLSEPAMHLNTDYQCLQIILKNLLDNALRYGDENQPVAITVEEQCDAVGKPGVSLTVANKTGLAAWPDPDKVFKKYYRSPGAKMISGTGLGLFLVQSVVRIIGGTCTYAPDDTHVRFKLWLPT